MPTSSSYHTYLIEALKDPDEAAAYLDAVLADEDFDFVALHIALRNVAAAKQLTQEDPDQAKILGILTQTSHPDPNLLLKILSQLGFQLSIIPKTPTASGD